MYKIIGSVSKSCYKKSPLVNLYADSVVGAVFGPPLCRIMSSENVVLHRHFELIAEIKELKKRLRKKESEFAKLLNEKNGHTLSNDELARYSRQIIIPQIGVAGQEKLKSSGVLVVGCGGLGCPAAQYLAGCGIGRIGLVDYDNVEINNLHRQLLHTEANVGLSKVKSAAQALQRLNSGVVVTEHDQQLDSLNALELVKCYDVVIDASDNVPTRYLVNDACVLSGVPLVSGSAVQLEGQLTVYNYKGGPCYRCLFPKPPPPQAVTNCGDAGVLGPVPGVIGVLEALQAVHMLLGNEEGVLSSRLVLFDGSASLFRTIRLRTRRNDCPVCGDNPTVTSLCDYEQFCGIPANDKGCGVKLLCSEDRVTAEELCYRLDGGVSRMVVDVRSPQEFEMCRLPGSINVPLPQIGDARHNSQFKAAVQQAITSDPNLTVYVLCRRGNDSQLAVAELKKMFPEFSDRFKDLQGGLHSWAKNVDNSFPVY